MSAFPGLRSTLHGADLTRALRVAVLRAKADAAPRLRAAGLVLERAIKLQLSTPPSRSGRLYRRGRTVVHRASAPGESPAPDTGALRNSVRLDVVRTLTVRVVVEAQTARWLELGTLRIAPRPFMRPALRKALPELRALGVRVRAAQGLTVAQAGAA